MFRNELQKYNSFKRPFAKNAMVQRRTGKRILNQCEKKSRKVGLVLEASKNIRFCCTMILGEHSIAESESAKNKRERLDLKKFKGQKWISIENYLQNIW